MNNRIKKFLSLLNALQRENVNYVLIGGFAVVLHGSSRFTEDIVLFVRNTENNINNLRKALSSIFNDESINEITSSELSQYAVIRYGAPDEILIDIIANLGETFSYDDIVSEEIEVEGHKVRIATLESLYKLKEKTYRAIDQEDLFFIAQKIKEKHSKDD
ncbi:MAG: nucleotidyl transferase AbiEii/AbiGii toxin family protein [Ignavibacteria bacterium]|nr:nucleotidyl transferase AbiEii/AbiGii toxin family protein [Ignavibacteria bacterium]MDP3830064.1 nucleotidyl transferase AbiEii/AbiGii toxin family protein [Ignavibacteriaceae bacterium]